MISENKKNLIRGLMFKNGSVESQHEFIAKVLETVKTIFPQAVDVSLADVAEDVLNEIIPIYDEVFTEDELKELQKFFDTETGRNYFKKMERITDESIKIGEKIGSLIVNKIQEQQKNGTNGTLE